MGVADGVVGDDDDGEDVVDCDFGARSIHGCCCGCAWIGVLVNDLQSSSFSYNWAVFKECCGPLSHADVSSWTRAEVKAPGVPHTPPTTVLAAMSSFPGPIPEAVSLESAQ